MTTRHWIIKRGDAVSLLRRMPHNSVDLIATDLPYESIEKHRTGGSTNRLMHSKMSSNDWFKTFPNSRIPVLMEQCFRVLRPNRHCYFWCDDETSDVLRAVARRTGFTVWKRLVWDKVAIGMGYHYRSRYEFILFLEKGKRKLSDLGVPDIITAKRIKGGYPTEKPPEVYEVLITQSTEPGERVLDPFCGSGAGGVAALRTGRKFIGFDISGEAMKISRRRLEAADGSGTSDV